jgi:hypothetical protein
MFYWRVKLKRKINLTKGSKNKKYQKNDYQIEKKKHITNWDWRMKLKKNQHFTKGQEHK